MYCQTVLFFHPCADTTSGITRQVSRSSGATVCRAAAAYNACFALRIAPILFPMTLALYFFETFITFTWNYGTRVIRKHQIGIPFSPVLVYWVSVQPGYIGMMPVVGQYTLVCCKGNLLFHRSNHYCT
jgi:hypothetical protein